MELEREKRLTLKQVERVVDKLSATIIITMAIIAVIVGLSNWL